MYKRNIADRILASLPVPAPGVDSDIRHKLNGDEMSQAADDKCLFLAHHYYFS
jgi:hypothetical protein